jgi:hypothetical protein
MTNESENDMSIRLIKEVMRGKASKVDRTIWLKAEWEKADVSFDDFDDDASPAAMRVRKAEDVSVSQQR